MGSEMCISYRLEEVIGASIAVVERLLGERPVTTDVSRELVAPFDAVLVQQVLVNLLENAAKYTGPNSAIDISAKRADDEVEIVVADRGPGLPGGDEARIFEKFYRIDDRLSRTKEGSGLGLAIVKHVARAHHARVTVESAPGKGSKFTIVLPAAPPSLSDAKTKPKPRAKTTPKREKKDTSADAEPDPTVIAARLT